MARIVDLGNGYGRLKGYPSKYASLTFPLTKTGILKLHVLGILSDDEVKDTLLKMGYEFSTIKWLLGVTRITAEKLTHRRSEQWQG